MNSRITNLILLGIIALVVGVGAYALPLLPEKIASHWNAAGEVNGVMGKFWGIFLLPLVMVIMYIVYIVIPLIDPLKGNIESFRTYYNAFWIFMFTFLLYIFFLMLAWNFGYRFNFSFAMIPAMAALFYLIGTVLEKSKRNWFVGIRTPWTLSSDIVWEKTHKLGARLFKLVALLALAGLFFGSSYAITLLAVSVGVAVVATVVYSYIEFRKQK